MPSGTTWRHLAPLGATLSHIGSLGAKWRFYVKWSISTLYRFYFSTKILFFHKQFILISQKLPNMIYHLLFSLKDKHAVVNCHQKFNKLRTFTEVWWANHPKTSHSIRKRFWCFDRITEELCNSFQIYCRIAQRTFYRWFIKTH